MRVHIVFNNGAQYDETIAGPVSTWQALARQVAQAHGYGATDVYRIVINGTEHNRLDL